MEAIKQFKADLQNKLVSMDGDYVLRPMTASDFKVTLPAGVKIHCRKCGDHLTTLTADFSRSNPYPTGFIASCTGGQNLTYGGPNKCGVCGFPIVDSVVFTSLKLYENLQFLSGLGD